MRVSGSGPSFRAKRDGFFDICCPHSPQKPSGSVHLAAGVDGYSPVDQTVPSGNLTVCYCKWPSRNRGFTWIYPLIAW